MDPCELTARYFDGEAGDDEARALDHLAGCAKCQRELGDLIGVEVALGRAPAGDAMPAIRPERAATSQPRRRWLLPITGLALAAAAAATVVVLDRTSPRARPVVLALADTRTIEARFTSPIFDRHRPYATTRGGGRHEDLSLAALATLERRGELATLVAAQAARGETAQAELVLNRMPASAARDADLAALAVTAGRAEDALIAADRALGLDPGLTSARWNRALALRDLGYGLVSAREFERVAQRGEAAWADEARALAAGLRAPSQDRLARYAAFAAAGERMVDRQGPLLTDDAIRARPGLARSYYLDALLGSTTADEARALAPMAQTLDATTGTTGAADALAATATVDWRRRAPLALAYRDLVLRRLDPSRTQALIARLEAVGPLARDLWVGALIRTDSVGTRLADFTAYAEERSDPWYLLRVVHARAGVLIAAGARDRAEVVLSEGLEGCDARAWGLLCARLSMDLASLHGGQSRYADAATFGRRAARMLAEAGAVPLEDYVLSYVAEVERGRGRLALAAAGFEELLARIPDSDCTTRRFARAGLALIAAYRGDAATAGDPGAADACDAVPYGLELVAMVDLARLTGRVEDRARAQAWLTQGGKGTGPGRLGAVEVAREVLALSADPAARERLRTALAKLDTASEEDGAVKTWAVGALIDSQAADGDWAGTAATAVTAAGLTSAPPCTLVASVDRAHGEAIALDGAGRATGVRTSAASPEAWDGPTLVPAAVREALRGCPAIGVLARPPLHGRADLLPPAMAWSFLGDPRPAADAATRPPRTVVVGDARPPAALGYPALAPLVPPAGATALRSSAATPSQVLDAMADATYVELHVHGQLDPTVADGAFLALSPGADERWALTATEVRQRRFAAAPVVVLAACRAAEVAPFLHARWSLPDAFLAAGARAVIAPTVEIPDDQAAPFFDELRRRITAGERPAVALAAVRAATLARGQAWAASVVAFE